MADEPIILEIDFASSKLRLETGMLAKQAGGAVLARYGESTVLAAVVEGPPRGEDFFPLTVDYRERTYAAGKFPGGFRKREGAPNTKEILTSRLTDRPLRPLFPKGYRNELQVHLMVLTADKDNDPDILAIIAASAALSVAKVPFLGPLAAVRVGRVNGEWILMPTYAQLAKSDMDIVLAVTEEKVMMIEGFANEVPEPQVAEALKLGHDSLKPILALQRQLRERVGLPPVERPVSTTDALFETLQSKYLEELKTAKLTPGKLAREAAVDTLRQRVLTEQVVPAGEGEGPTASAVDDAFYRLERRAVRDLILAGKRLDGRQPTEIRPLFSQVGLLPRVHGSALFQRGETQALLVATLGGGTDEQKVDGLGEDYSKKFMLDYNFPSFSVGECRPIRGPGRREIGHGALAERSLKPVLPGPEKFPYTIRIVAEILESNGSTSMATTCAGTLCLMDAGVPIKDPVAGISIGLVQETDDQYLLLTDIMGEEDFFGDMDFKVAGSQHGVTGIQLDLKHDGLSHEIIRNTLKQARKARIEILIHMMKTLNRPKKEISIHAPRVARLQIDPAKIGVLIGPGGKHIRALQEETDTQVDIEDTGIVTILGPSKEKVEAAAARVEAIGRDIEVGRVYRGRVSAVADFGAFVEIAPGRDGLLHISQLGDGYVKKVTDVCKVGDIVEVQVIGIDDHDRIRLSRKALDKRAEPARA